MSALLPILILLALTDAHAGVSFDFEQMVVYDPGYVMKDHTLVYRNGRYHIFYIRGDEQSFGHASSPDLKHWTLHDTVLYTGPEEWDERMIWAPFIVDARGDIGYDLMYYTGVNMPVAQRVCLAYTTDDVFSWLKAPVEMFTPFHGDTSWCDWSEDSWSNYRDPHFFEDGGYQYMINTAWTKDHLGAIALARSTDYLNWVDMGPLYEHNSWHVLESSFLVKWGGRYHLFFTEEKVAGISYMSSDSLTTGWDITKRSIIDSGAASEFFQVSPDRFLISRHSGYLTPTGDKISTIKIDTVTFHTDGVQVNMTNYLAEDWIILSGDAFLRQPTFGDNPSFRGEPEGTIGFEGNWWIGTYESYSGPMTGTLPGGYRGDGATGAMRTKDFTIKGDTIRLLVGGGFYPSSCYVALCDSETDRLLFRETGEDTDLMSERIWEVSSYKDRSVYIKIVDEATGEFGHINVDGIEERSYRERITGRKDLIKERFRDTTTLFPLAERGGPKFTLSNHPNPFNPTTDIVFTANPGQRITLLIYDVSGREIERIDATAGSDGRGIARWGGAAKRGHPVSSGVYLCVMKEGDRILSTRKLILDR